MNIFRRELNSNFKNFVIWTGVTTILYFVIICLYPSIISSGDISSLMSMFPDELLKAFNMDLTNISTASGWLFSEGIVLYVIVGSLYSCMLGATIVLKEENDKTIEFLYAKPITKNQILSSKIACGLLYIVAFTVIVSISSVLGLFVAKDLKLSLALNLFLSPLMIFLTFYSLLILFATIMRKTKSVLSISFGIVFGFYFIQIFSVISNKVSFLKYFTVFTLSDSRYILEHASLNPWCLLISFLIFSICITISYINYNKKEFF